MTNEELEAAMDSENPKHISECGDLDWHEVLDRAFLVADMFERHVFNHPVVQLHPELKSRCDDIVDSLWGIYCSVPNYEDAWNEERALAGKDEAAIAKYHKDRMEKNWPDPFRKSDAVDDIAKAAGFEVISHKVWKGEL